MSSRSIAVTLAGESANKLLNRYYQQIEVSNLGWHQIQIMKSPDYPRALP